MPLTGQPRYPSQVPRRGRAMRNLSVFFSVCVLIGINAVKDSGTKRRGRGRARFQIAGRDT